MKYLVISQVYTIMAFGASIFLWPFLTPIPIIPSPEGTPLYLIHPFFTIELFLMLSTAIVWVMAMLISLHSLRKQRIALTESIIQNLFIVSLALTTVIVAISGYIVYSETIHFEKYHNNLMDLQGISPPNPFAICYGLGILFCESAWIITGLLKCLEHLKKSRR